MHAASILTCARNCDTALMIASYRGNVAAVKAFLDKETESNNTGWTAFHSAATVGNNEIVRMLLDASAYIDAGSPNSLTVIDLARKFDYKDIADGLI
jgi:uncharacterized protein